MRQAVATATVLRRRPPWLDSIVRCYTCQGSGIVESLPDPVAARDRWPEVPCLFTRGCAGRVVPEALN